MAEETLNDIARRLEQVRAEMQATVERTRARQSRFRILTIVVALFLCAYFYFAYTKMAAFNAETAVMNVESQLRSALPQAREQLEAELKRRAPEIVSAGAQQLLLAPAGMKNMLVTVVTSNVNDQIATI